MTEDRINWWNSHYTIKFQGNSDPVPFMNIKNYHQYFENKNVLELGPGEGRQFQMLKPFTSKYSIADISPKVLGLPIYDCLDKRVINGYHLNFPEKFDTIHCWYVIHHITKEELFKVFLMVKTMLKPTGNFLFNFSIKGIENGDGIKTTLYSTMDIVRVSELYEFSLMEYYFKEKNNVIVNLKNSVNG
jgi:SAM-dependent methyltransferase